MSEFFKRALVVKFNRVFISSFAFGLFVSSTWIPSVGAATTPAVTWKLSALEPSTSYSTSRIGSTNSIGAKVWTVSGSCRLKNGKIETLSSGTCTIKLTVRAKGKFASKVSSKRFSIRPLVIKSKMFFRVSTEKNGLGDDWVNGVYVVGSTVYAATNGGLSISTDGGNTFTNRTEANGLGSGNVNGVYVVGSTVYAATYYGLSISTDGGNTFTNRTTESGLGADFAYGEFVIEGVYVDGSTVYVAATDRHHGTDGTGGVGISTDGGKTFTMRTKANGLGHNYVTGVYVVGSTVYAATYGGLSVSTDGGNTFTNHNTANNGERKLTNLRGLYADSSFVYTADANGLSVSTDGGNTFAYIDALDNAFREWAWVLGVYGVGAKIYAATTNGLAISYG